ncbi:hypothetical protein NFI96_024140 [Prochilodus magdalenae]|nr:hypothetical protein NFI96_024140 [Prochilodus magdalenae]
MVPKHWHDYSEGQWQKSSIWRFDSKSPLTPTYENDTLDQFWNGTNGDLQEVISLIKRLESDRQEAKEAVQKENLRAQTLRRKQDSLSLWKQQQFPAAVQTEYETCFRDIAELKWHFKVKKDQMQLAKNSLSHTEVQNCQLVEDIDFVKKHSPIVKEKLQLESEIMKQIKSAQAETNEMLTKLCNELSRSQQELESMGLLANKERELMTMELKDSRNHLKDHLSDLQQLKSSWDCYHTRVSETEEKIALNDKQLEAILLRIPFLEGQETKINNAIMEQRAKLEEQDKELSEKHSGIAHLQKQIQTARREGEAKLFECEEVFSKKWQELLLLNDENKEHEMENEDYKKKIRQSNQAVQQLQRGCKQILEKNSQIEEEREQLEDKLILETVQHTNTKARLEDLKLETYMWEQRMRDKTSSVMEDHNVVKEDYERAKNELLKEYEDVSSTTAQLETEMVELKNIHKVKSKKIADLKTNLSDILTDSKRLCGDLEETLNSTCVKHLNSVKKAFSAVSVRCEQTSSRLEELKLKSEECREASDIMKHIAITLQNNIEELQNMSQMVEYKHNTAKVLMNSFQSDTVACRSRTDLSEKAYSTLLDQRHTVMLNIKANLKKALKENGELAQEYSVTQKALLNIRQEAMCMCSKKNEVEASFHDYKQLSLLQRRMHKAMLKYFKHRSVYSQAELARFQALSNQNNQKMKALQEELLRAIRRISAFLHSLTDDSTTSHDVAVAADEQRRMDNDGLNRAMPTVHTAK